MASHTGNADFGMRRNSPSRGKYKEERGENFPDRAKQGRKTTRLGFRSVSSFLLNHTLESTRLPELPAAHVTSQLLGVMFEDLCELALSMAVVCHFASTALATGDP